MDLSIRSLSKLAITIHDQDLEIIESDVKEGADLNFGKSKIMYFSKWCDREKFFHCSILCKWITSLAYPTWVICNQV